MLSEIQNPFEPEVNRKYWGIEMEIDSGLWAESSSRKESYLRKNIFFRRDN